MTEEIFKPLLKEVKNARDTLDELKTELKKRQGTFDEKNAILINQIKMHNEEVGNREGMLKKEAVAYYKKYDEHSKQLFGGIGIKIMSTMEYDNEMALEWAKEHSLALKLDVTAFKKIAKAQKLPCVKYDEETTATIPSKIELEE